MDLGPEPPEPPRKLPDGFALRVRLTRNVPMIIGLGFTLIGGFMTVAMISVKTWAALFPAFFLLGGLGMLKMGFQEGVRVLDAFRHGRAVRGKAASVREDTQTTVNGRHPWEIIYTFEAEGQPYEGKVTTFEAATANRFYGQPPVWVLVVEDNPERNTVYPPIR
jgi:hypothetical protein